MIKVHKICDSRSFDNPGSQLNPKKSPTNTKNFKRNLVLVLLFKFKLYLLKIYLQV